MQVGGEGGEGGEQGQQRHVANDDREKRSSLAAALPAKRRRRGQGGRRANWAKCQALFAFFRIKRPEMEVGRSRPTPSIKTHLMEDEISREPHSGTSRAAVGWPRVCVLTLFSMNSPSLACIPTIDDLLQSVNV